MRKQCLRILCALIAVTGLGIAAHGQTVDRLDVKIPFEFVAAGKVLPAGNYSVRRLQEANGGSVLLLSSFEKRASVFVIPAQFESEQTDKVGLTFEELGGHYVLTVIQTPDHLFTTSVSRKEIMAAAMKSQSGASAAGSMPGNN